MGELWALLPADGIAVVKTAPDALAHRTPGVPDERTADQRRADALVELCAHALSGAALSGLPSEHGHRPAIQVTVALSTLLGVDDQPGELDGYGPIPAALARRLAHDPSGTWRRLVTDECGRLVDYGRRTYRPPAELADHVIARDQTCTFPGCQHRARTCHLDHAIDWERGGPTNEPNLGALCPRHHKAKHAAHWRLRRTTDGHAHWTSPTGHHYTRHPATYPLDHTRASHRGTADDNDCDPEPPPF